MSWTWDTERFTHDATCWTYDGHNQCPYGGGGGMFGRHLTGQTAYQDEAREKFVRDRVRKQLELREQIESAYDGKKAPAPQYELDQILAEMPTTELRAILEDDEVLALFMILLLA